MLNTKRLLSFLLHLRIAATSMAFRRLEREEKNPP
jgi:hypothetical protein